MKFKNAIVKKPARTMVNGITTANLGKPDYKKALKEHENYVKTLKECGVEVEILEADENFPDSTFVEDPAVLTDKCAIITNPGAESRKKEVNDIKNTIKKYYSSDKIFEIKAPGTLEGGDVMQVDNHFYIGISDRTNKEGAKQLLDYLNIFGYTGDIVEFDGILHLKTGMSYIGDNTLLITELFADKNIFTNYKKIKVSEKEGYASNCIRVNDYVIVPAGFPKTKKAIENKGFRTKTVNVSEFRKIDGGLSCLSLRF
ncbi:MAG: dimethylarginine dimethylaminohydrolase family protein [Bacillota bacterium]